MTNSYFINALGCDTHGLPAVSLCADSLDLFDFETGIFVPGIHFDSLDPYFTGNYFMRGREWERLSNIEFYELDNHGINQQVGLRTHGKSARWQNQKGFSIYAREEYGNKRIKYKFFDNIPISNFKRLTLKPYASAWNGSGCKDYISNRIAQHLNVEFMASRPSVLFINGEYCGVYYVEEKPDERFLEDHFDVDKEDVNIIKSWSEADYGTMYNYNALFEWMQQADLKDVEQYAYAEAHIDMENFIDYYILELFTANLDWPASNTRMWQVNNGKWRWIFYDGDACLEAMDYDVFANATYDGDAWYPSSRKATLFFRRLLENEQFKAQFAMRFNELAFSVFAYQNTKPYFDYIKEALQDEVPNQIERYGIPVSYGTWVYYCMTVIDDFLMNRSDNIISALNDFISIEEPVVKVFQCFPNPSSGDIHVSFESDAFGAAEISIYDLMGRKVFSLPYLVTEGGNEIVINPNLTAGVYVLKAGNLSQRIVRY